MPFTKGRSGNPKGRPKGRGQAASLRRAISDDLPDIIEAMTERARDGDVAAARLLLDRAIPSLKADLAKVELPSLKNKSISEQGAVIFAAAGEGTISPLQASTLLSSLASLCKIQEVDELARRISALEKEGGD